MHNIFDFHIDPEILFRLRIGHRLYKKSDVALTWFCASLSNSGKNE
jgi:hypothetical protein